MRAKKAVTFSLERGMLVSVAIPLMLSFVLSCVLLSESWYRLSGTRKLANLNEFVQAIGSLIHEQQKERGATSVYLSSGGAQFLSKLQAQRALTDAAAAQLRTFADPEIRRGTAIGDALGPVAEGLDARGDLRARVDAQAIETDTALAAYTSHNRHMLNIISQIGSLTSEPALTARLAALQSLLSAKEYAGIERAIGSGGFAAGEFDLVRMRRLQDLISRQTDGLERFDAIAGDDMRQLVNAIDAMPETEELRLLRAAAFASYQSGDLQGITADDYFATTTIRINAFKSVEDRLIANVDAAARDLVQSSLILFGLVLLGAIVSFVFAITTTHYVVQNMLREVARISEAGNRMAQGDETVRMPEDTPKELGQIVWSINFFRKSVAEAKEREAEIVAAREAAEAAARKEEERRRRADLDRAERDAAKAQREQ
ncbi:MAG: nitrate- and nitrite sensing domain-containing protein, partial [Pseudomonadota bacterium]